MHLCFSCISYLSFGTEIAEETKTQPCSILTNKTRSIDFIGLYRLHRFFLMRTSEDKRRYDADKNYWRKCQIHR